MASIYALGDSHTQALGPLLKRALGMHDVRFQAFPGYSTKRAHAQAAIPSGQDVVVIALGGNDFGAQGAARRALVDAVRLRNPRASIVWFGPFTARRADVDTRHAEQTADQARQLQGLGVRFIDSRPFSTSGHAPDQVHFTGDGYTKIAKAMLEPIARGIVRRDGPPRPRPGGSGFAVALAGAGALVALLLLRRR